MTDILEIYMFPKKCPECKSKNIGTDKTETITYCKDCGLVLDEPTDYYIGTNHIDNRMPAQLSRILIWDKWLKKYIPITPKIK